MMFASLKRASHQLTDGLRQLCRSKRYYFDAIMMTIQYFAESNANLPKCE